METGAIIWFDTQKGYGFIAPDAGGKGVFVHVTSPHRGGIDVPRKGDRVWFEAGATRNGKLRAEKVERAP